MKVNSISNYTLGVSNNYNNKNAKATPHFTAIPVPTPGVYEHRADEHFVDLLKIISAKISAGIKKPAKKQTAKMAMTPEAKTLYENVQKKCDGSSEIFAPKKSPVLQKMANFYKNEEIMSARNAKK